MRNFILASLFALSVAACSSGGGGGSAGSGGSGGGTITGLSTPGSVAVVQSQ